MTSKSAQVKVYLVGAGPGDVGLITARALEVLAQADVVVYDYLSNGKLLDHARSDARFINVGKKGFEKHVTQDEINDLLVNEALALAGTDGNSSHSIVRLKGGDPFVFGRGGEEALALAHAGIPFEVIPGVTSGIAAPAYAGIPVTHRKVASSVTFVTGHEDPTRSESSIDWPSLAGLVKRGDTVCFYMGIRSLPHITEQLMAFGANSETPVALVRWGTTPQQETLVGNLADIAERAERAKFAAPAIIVVGEVVNLRNELTWFEQAPLFGKRILVTRSRTQASALSAKLSALGAEAIEVPTIDFTQPDDSFSALDAAIEHIDAYNWVVFTSVNGVDAFFNRLQEAASCAGFRDARCLHNSRVVAIGPATAKRLRGHGIAADVVPSEYRGEAVCTSMVQAGLKEGDQVLIPRAQVAREVLPQMLREAGADVEVVAAYKTCTPASSSIQNLETLLAEKEIDGITFTSSSTVRNLMSMLGEEAASKLKGLQLYSIGPITTGTLEEYGLQATCEAREYTIDGLVEAICNSNCAQ